MSKESRRLGAFRYDGKRLKRDEAVSKSKASAPSKTPPPPPPPAAQAPNRDRSLKNTTAPTAADFKESAIRRAILSETLQHPFTVLPLAGAAVGCVYLGLIGAGPLALGATLGAGVIGAGAFVVNFFVRGEKLVERHLDGLKRRRKRAELGAAAEFEHRWRELGHADGVTQAVDLRNAYAKLLRYLEKREAEKGRSLHLERLRVLAEDTYAEGLRVHETAVAIEQAISEMDPARLNQEVESYEAQLVGELADASQREAMGKRLELLKRRQHLYKERQSSVTTLLAESEVLESALETTYLEIVQLERPEALLESDGTATALERSVEAARRVEERLRHELTPNDAADGEYLEAGGRR